MGYRSEVVFAVAPEAVPVFMAIWAGTPELLDWCFNHSDTLETGVEYEGDFLFQWDHIKWYPTYPDIEALEAFMDALESDDLSQYGEKEERDWHQCFKFVRIGEDLDDTDQRGYGFNDVRINRSISF